MSEHDVRTPSSQITHLSVTTTCLGVWDGEWLGPGRELAAISGKHRPGFVSLASAMGARRDQRTVAVPFSSEESTPETWVTLPLEAELVRVTLLGTPEMRAFTLVETVAGMPSPEYDCGVGVRVWSVRAINRMRGVRSGMSNDGPH